VRRIERQMDQFDPAQIRSHAESFSLARFQAEMRSAIEQATGWRP
jgi:hypothetical protein